MKPFSIALLLQTAALSAQAFQISNVRSNGRANFLASSPSAVNQRLTTTARNANEREEEHEPSSSSSSSLEIEMGDPSSNQQQKRRSFLQNVAAKSILFSSAVGTTAGSNAFAEESSPPPPPPSITHKVTFDVRISRADGSFYVRDASPDSSSPDDEPFYATLVFGLYGNDAPEHVQQFLNYVDVKYEVDNPLPSYSRSKFTTLDSATGLLIGGTIPGLDVTTLAGGNVLQYSGRVLPAKLWLEDKSKITTNLRHDAKGLLTHRNLDLSPSFGITTRKSSSALDATHTVFGCVLEDANGFMNRVVDLPVLTDNGVVSRTSTTEEAVTVGGGSSLASSVFTAQRSIMRDAAKTFGDSRLEKVYDGKLLRRVEVTKVGVL